MESISRYSASVKRPYTAGSAVSAGAIVLAAGLAACVIDDIAASATGDVAIAGRFDVASASGTTFAVGDPVYWDNSGKLAVKTFTTFYLGKATKAKVSGELVVEVDLNAPLTEISVNRAVTSDEGTANYVDIDVGFAVGTTAAPKCTVDAAFRVAADGTSYATSLAITHNPGSAAPTTVRIAGTDITTSHTICARIKQTIA